MKEIFKEIEGFPNYEVSNTGIVRNKKRKKIKKPGYDKKGYLKVDLYKNSKRSTRKIHNLVANAFIAKDDTKSDINHKDGNKHNNTVNNLERCTKSENMIHAYEHGLEKPHASYGMLGKKNPNAGLKKRPVRIIETGQVFNSIRDCERYLNRNRESSKGHVNDCLSGKQKTYRGYHFEYV